MRRLRVLWLSNKLQMGMPVESGTWLDALAGRLMASEQVQLGNIGFAPVRSPERRDAGGIQQWAIPSSLDSNAGPSVSDRRAVLAAVAAFRPDLVHVWGTEGNWGLLTADEALASPVLLELQGLKSAIASVFHGGLSLWEQLRCVGVREVLRRKTVWQQQAAFARWGERERAIIRGHRHISVQSEWHETHIAYIAPGATIHRNDLVLRDEFYRASQWRYSGQPAVFCALAYSAPFKGLHVAIRAVAHLRRRYPGVQLRIAGPQPGRGVRRHGYLAWIEREIESAGLASNVVWLGPTPAGVMVEELLRCSAIVVPSYVESYCVVLCEAMSLGVPAVVSYAGSLPKIARPEASALFISPGDDVTCAHQLERLISDRSLAERVSEAALRVASERSDPLRIVERQLEIYRAVAGGRAR